MSQHRPGDVNVGAKKLGPTNIAMLRRVQARGGYANQQDAIRAALEYFEKMQLASQDGFTIFFAIDPRTDLRKNLMISKLVPDERSDVDESR